MTHTTVLRLAGPSALLAIPALILSAIFLALFFGGAGAVFGPLNDLFVAATTGLLILPALAFEQLRAATATRTAQGWARIVTGAAVIGLAISTAGQLLLVFGIINLEASFLVGGIGIVPVVVWAGAQTYFGLRLGLPSRAAGNLMLTVLAAAGLITLSAAIRFDLGTTAFTVAFLGAFAAYLAVLAKTLRSTS